MDKCKLKNNLKSSSLMDMSIFSKFNLISQQIQGRIRKCFGTVGMVWVTQKEHPKIFSNNLPILCKSQMEQYTNTSEETIFSRGTYASQKASIIEYFQTLIRHHEMTSNLTKPSTLSLRKWSARKRSGCGTEISKSQLERKYDTKLIQYSEIQVY